MLSEKPGSNKFINYVPVFLLFLGLGFGTLAAFQLRENNLNMIRLREAVYAADRAGGNVEFALKELRVYVYAHMNTDLSSGGNSIKPPIQLKGYYENLVAKESQRVEEKNAKIYTDAQDYCEQQNPTSFYGASRISCIEDYVSKNKIKELPIEDSLYKFDFASPKWSPDLAGWSLVISLICIIASITIFVLRALKRRTLGQS